jgi:hypothetical protein
LQIKKQHLRPITKKGKYCDTGKESIFNLTNFKDDYKDNRKMRRRLESEAHIEDEREDS